MYAGLREADGDYRVFMDADLQHPPELLPEMYQAVSGEGYDCCGGKRMGRDGDGALRSFCSRMFYKVCKALTHMDMGDGYGDFRMMNRQMAECIALECRDGAPSTTSTARAGTTGRCWTPSRAAAWRTTRRWMCGSISTTCPW